MGLILRDYQQSTINGVRDEVRKGNNRPLVVLATGAGKSPILAQIAQSTASNGKKVLIVLHRRHLVRQIIETLGAHFGINAGVIMAGEETNLDRAVQVVSIATYGRRLSLDALRYNQYFVDADVILLDEAHHSPAKQFMEVIKLYKDKIVIGFTATASRADGRGLGEVFNALVDVTGVKELTKRGYLAPVRYFVPGRIDLDGVKMAMGDYQVKALAEKTDNKKLVGDIVQNWLKLAENRKTIVFCVNVAHSISVSDAFNAAGIPAEYLNARHSDEERADVFERMDSGDIKVLVNVALFQEGLDVPDVSCVVIARPTKSMGLYRQMGGRGLRPQEGKTCLLLDHGNVVETHGLLEEEIEWSLDGEKKAWSRKNVEPGEAKLLKCRVCSEIFKGSSTCPTCGTSLKTFGKPIETIDAELEELKQKKKTNKMDFLEKRKLMGALVWHAEKNGYKAGWAAHAYRDYFSVWPNDKRVKNVPAIAPEGATANLLKYLLIKKAKSYKKQQAA